MLLGGGSHHLLLTRGQVSHHFQQQKADLVSSSCRRKEDTRTGPERVRGIHQSKQHFGTSSIVVLATDGAADLPQWGSSWLEAADSKKLTTGGASIHEAGEEEAEILQIMAETHDLGEAGKSHRGKTAQLRPIG